MIVEIKFPAGVTVMQAVEWLTKHQLDAFSSTTNLDGTMIAYVRFEDE